MVAYEIHDSYGCPQCGVWVEYCETWFEVEEYFEDEDAEARLHEGYAIIVEVEV